MEKLIVIVLMMGLWITMITGCTAIKNINKESLNFAGSIVVNKLSTANTINGNPYSIKADIIQNIQDGIQREFKKELFTKYQLTLADKCDNNTLEIQGEIVKVSTDTDLKKSALLIGLSHTEFITEVDIKGSVIECETQKVINTFEISGRDSQFDDLTHFFADKIVEEFRYLAVKK